MQALALTGWPGLVQAVPADEEARAEETRLIELARHDAQAMAQLFRLHYSAIVCYIRRRVGNTSTADDLTSEVFLAMVRHLPRYRITNTPLRGWLYRIATNQVNRWARRQRRWAWQQLHDLSSPEQPASDQDTAAHLRTALLTLPLPFQSTLALHYLEQLDVQQVAGVLGCAVGTVKSRLARGRAMLKKLLCEQDDPS